jgi:hypothetical protein
MVLKLSDSVIARIAQIVQEGMLLGVDVVDLMRQITVEPMADCQTLDLTPEYAQSVKEMHKKLLDEAAEHQKVRDDSKIIFNS